MRMREEVAIQRATSPPFDKECAQAATLTGDRFFSLGSIVVARESLMIAFEPRVSLSFIFKNDCAIDN